MFDQIANSSSNSFDDENLAGLYVKMIIAKKSKYQLEMLDLFGCLEYTF